MLHCTVSFKGNLIIYKSLNKDTNLDIFSGEKLFVKSKCNDNGKAGFVVGHVVRLSLFQLTLLI